jgi:hypothetical protein
MKSQAGHLQINVKQANIPFYKELFTFLEWAVLCDEPTMLGVGDPHGVSLWFAGEMKDVRNDYDGPGTNHIAIAVAAQADVDQAVEYLKTHSVPALFDTPRHRPEFCGSDKDTYYQVMFESPDKLLFEIVYTGPKA